MHTDSHFFFSCEGAPGYVHIISIFNRPSSSEVLPLPRSFAFLPQQAGLKRARGSKRFSPYEVSRKSSSTMTWTHKFVCLSDSSQEDIPVVSEKHKLKCAGLGERKIVFRLDGKYADIKETLLPAYPTLEKGGGFELMRTAGPYSKHLTPIDAKFTSSVASRNLLTRHTFISDQFKMTYH